MAGTWTKIPTACSSSYAVATRKCTEWGTKTIKNCTQWADHGSYQCSQWADHGSYQCSQWADHGYNSCSHWGSDCHWYTFWNCIIEWFCDAWYWVVNLVCQAWYWLANLVCQAWYWLAKIVCVLFTLIFELFCLLWQWVTHWFCFSNFNGGTMLLLTDGSVILNECSGGYGTHQWWKLTPDINGNYLNGTWNRIASSKFGRKYFASAVLADGRVIVCGGEYSDVSGSNSQDDTNKCEIYDPVANSWSDLVAPAAMGQIGDSPCCTLPDGKFLLGNFNSTNVAIFDPANPGTPWTSGGTGGAKNDSGSEETWLLMPDGVVLSPQCVNHPNSEKYIISSDKWVNEGALPVDLVESSSIEIGPAVLLPDGRGFYAGSTGSTALYTMPAVKTSQGTWTAGPAVPQINQSTLGSKDGPACLMTNGNVLVPFSPVDGIQNNYNSPCYFFEFDGTNLNRVADPATSNCPTYVGRMMLLPTGEVLFAREDSSDIYAYVYTQAPQNSWRPTISTCPNVIAPGSSIHVSGTQFNGLSQAVGYGDDSAAATNYPIVRLKNDQTGHIRYCRTSNHTISDRRGHTVTSMGVATGHAIVTTQVDIPADVELGESELVVVANGIPSDPFAVTISRRKG